MKCKNVLTVTALLLMFLFSATTTQAELLIEIGDVDIDAVQNLKGLWVIENSRYTFDFTDQFVCRINGQKFFLYKRNNTNSADPWVYTIVKSKRTKQWYFSRGNYRDGRFYGSTSRIVFEDKNNITVYSGTDPRKVFFRAGRYVPKSQEKKEPPS